MDLAKSSLHSFIVKLWVEAATEEVERVMWQGHITHVPDGERRYLRDLDEIVAFIEPYLAASGVEIERGGVVKRWMRRWKLHSM